MFRQMDEAYCKRDLKIHTDNTECVGDGCGNVNSDKTLLNEVNWEIVNSNHIGNL